ncbi:MAG: hypothetical protein ABJA57_07555 [Ginsengibacter sp.]
MINKKHAFSITLLSATLFISCFKQDNGFGGSSGINCTPSDANQVLICNSKFNPDTLTIKVGSLVTWHNSDVVVHTVVADNSLINSGNIEVSGNFSYHTSFVGTFQYHCSLHQEAGVLIVEP